jgi:hypothetical protein
MIHTMLKMEVSSKLRGWLGFLQGVLFCLGLRTIEQLRDETRGDVHGEFLQGTIIGYDFAEMKDLEEARNRTEERAIMTRYLTESIKSGPIREAANNVIAAGEAARKANCEHVFIDGKCECGVIVPRPDLLPDEFQTGFSRVNPRVVSPPDRRGEFLTDTGGRPITVTFSRVDPSGTRALPSAISGKKTGRMRPMDEDEWAQQQELKRLSKAPVFQRRECVPGIRTMVCTQHGEPTDLNCAACEAVRIARRKL